MSLKTQVSKYESRMVSRRDFLRLGGAGLAGTALLAGCGQSSGSGQDSEGELDRFNITISHWPTSCYGAPVAVGMDQGLFEEEGIEIGEVIPGEGGGSSVRNVLSGDLPFGIPSAAASITSWLSGAPLQIVGGSVRTTDDNYFVTRKGAPFEEPEDFIGRRWSITNPGSTTETTAQLIFDQEDIDPSSVEIVAGGGLTEALTLLRNNEVDIATLTEPLYSIEGDQYKTLWRWSEYVPNFQQTVIVASPQVIQQDPDLVERFLRAHETSVQSIYDNPEEAGRIFAKYAEIDETPGINAIESLAAAKFWSTGVDTAAINAVVKGLQINGVFEDSGEISWEELLNQEYLPEDLRVDPTLLETGG